MLASLLDEKGLTASDLLDAINALANIKKREAEAAEKAAQTPERKIYQDKEFVYDTRTDVFIYRDGRTKSGRYYVRIYDEKTKKDYVKSLRTSNRVAALAAADTASDDTDVAKAKEKHDRELEKVLDQKTRNLKKTSSALRKPGTV